MKAKRLSGRAIDVLIRMLVDILLLKRQINPPNAARSNWQRKPLFSRPTSRLFALRASRYEFGSNVLNVVVGIDKVLTSTQCDCQLHLTRLDGRHFEPSIVSVEVRPDVWAVPRPVLVAPSKFRAAETIAP